MIPHLYTVNYKVDDEHVYNLQFINPIKRYSPKEFKILLEFILDEDSVHIKGHIPATFLQLKEPYVKMRWLINALKDREFIWLSNIVFEADGYTGTVENVTNYEK